MEDRLGPGVWMCSVGWNGPVFLDGSALPAIRGSHHSSERRDDRLRCRSSFVGTLTDLVPDGVLLRTRRPKLRWRGQTPVRDLGRQGHDDEEDVESPSEEGLRGPRARRWHSGTCRPSLAARARQGDGPHPRVVQGGRTIDGAAQVVSPRSRTIRRVHPPLSLRIDVRGHEKVRTYGHEKSAPVATRSPQFWSSDVLTPR